MESAKLDDKIGAQSFSRHLLAWLMASPTLRWAIFLTIAIPLFYAEENWRGKRAWDRYKHEQKSKGLILDWSLRTQPAVPDNENFYRAPGMTEWFLRTATGSPTSPINPFGVPVSYKNRLLKVVVEILPYRAEDEAEPANVDLVLEYDPPVMRTYRPSEGAELISETNRIPLIIMDNVQLLDAIRNLARQAGVNYVLAPNVSFGQAGVNGTPVSQPTVSIRWEEITAMQALRTLLQNHNLLWVPDLKCRIGRIVPRDPNQPPVVLDKGVRERLEDLVRHSFGPFVYGSQGEAIFVRPIDQARPVRLAIRTHAPLGAGELAFLTSRQEFVYGEPLLNGLTIKETPNHSFFVVVPPTTACVAADYLDWSDQFEPDFDQMREALRRPFAVPPGTSTDPFSMPVENSVSMRAVGQTLAQRAQCQLLSGRPNQALKELTLLHDLCRILDGPPISRHTTLMTALIDADLAGMHASVVADGLHRKAWQEPQLAALQAQLERVNLCPALMRVFAEAPAFTCSAVEKAIAHPQKMRNPSDLMFDVVPRGWIYQNMVNLAELLQRLCDAMDGSGRLVVPHKVERAANNVQEVLSHFSVGTAFARQLVPDVVCAQQTMAFTQTTINQVALACALERYRVVRERYPDSIEALVPEFVRVLPVDIINGRPLEYSRIPDQGYQLYSVGWDEKDDGGIPAAGARWNNPAKGDWTWRFPVN